MPPCDWRFGFRTWAMASSIKSLLFSRSRTSARFSASHLPKRRGFPRPLPDSPTVAPPAASLAGRELQRGCFDIFKVGELIAGAISLISFGNASEVFQRHRRRARRSAVFLKPKSTPPLAAPPDTDRHIEGPCRRPARCARVRGGIQARFRPGSGRSCRFPCSCWTR